MEQSTRKTAVCMLALFVLTAVIFLGTVELRRSWVTLTMKYWADYETISLVGPRNYYREGFLNTWGAMCQKPKSIENDSVRTRDLYCSLPPGALVPLYLAGRILGQEPSLPLQQKGALAHHFLIALVLSLMAFVFLRQIGYGHRDSFLFACVPMLFELCTPVPLVAYRVGPYFCKEPVLLPFALYVFLEILRDSIPGRKRWRIVLSFLQSAVAFWGIMTEWIFAFLIPCVYVKRVVRGEMGGTVLSFLGKTVLFGFSSGLGILLFLLQIYHLGGLADVYERMQGRTGLSPPGILPTPLGIFFLGHLRQGYGIVGLVLFGGGVLCAALIAVYAVILLLKGRKPPPATSRTLSLIFMLLVPCLIYTVVFRRHVAHMLHFFCAYQFSIPFALIPFVLIPVLIVSLRGRDETSYRPSGGGRNPAGNRERAWPLLPLAMILGAIGYIAIETPAFLPQIAHQPLHPELIGAAKFVGANTAYEDVVFAQDSEFPEISSRRYVAYSMKEVYQALTAQAIYDKVKGIEGDYIINILSRGEDTFPAHSFFRGLIACAYDHRISEGFRLDKIRKSDFLAACHELGISETTPDPAPASTL